MKSKKILLFLTSCVTPHKDMPCTIVMDGEKRRIEYLNSINWYLKHTNYDLAIIDNSGFDFSSYLKEEKERFVIVDSFLTDDFNLKLGKGYGEGLIILRLLRHEIINDYDIIIKVSGRHVILNINLLSFACRYIPTSFFISAVWCKNDRFAVTDCFICSPSFLQNILSLNLLKIDESKYYYIEHVLSDSIEQAILNGYKYIFFIQPIHQIGVSGSTGLKLESVSSLKSKCAYIKNFFFSLLGLKQ